MQRAKQVLAVLIVLALMGAGTWGAMRVVAAVWRLFLSADPTLGAGILAAATTIVGSTLAVVLGRYYERKRDLEAAYRQKKTEIYDAFLQELFKTLNTEEQTQAGSDALVTFLREWQRKMILWGGQGVVKAYIDWMRKLKAGEPDAQSIFMLDKFFRAVRKDLGHSSLLLPQGTFVHLVLREGDLLLAAAKKNPKVKLSELAALEKSFEAKKGTQPAAKGSG